MLEMTERKKDVLKAIINEYVMTANPVGSRTLARRYDFGVSSATIRNEMADLEEMNYLEKPHKSAGRIPSDKGYRFYVDTLMELRDISKQQRNQIKSNYESKAKEIHELIEQTSSVLSDLTHYTSLVLSPQVQDSIFRSLKLVMIDSEHVLLILITDVGVVENKVISMPQELSRSELNEISRFLNERLERLALSKIDQQLLNQLEHKLINKIGLTDSRLDFLAGDLFRVNLGDKIYLGGTTNILEQPEFNDIHKVKAVLRVLEEEELLHNILGTLYDASDVEVIIGQENEFDEIKDCSMVTATYQVGDRAIGKIGVLGPRRMEYPNVVSIVKIVSQILSNRLATRD
ncbi:MAG: heat-inducible transcriptional repressor HrcA [Bacillota bacterium]